MKKEGRNQKANASNANNNNAMCSNHRCCAERRLIAEKIREARKHGVAPDGTVHWIRRKYGKDISVWRIIFDNNEKKYEYGCSIPCVLCRRELIRFDFNVHVTTGTEQWFHGYLTNDDAPVSKLTSGQMRTWT